MADDRRRRRDDPAYYQGGFRPGDPVFFPSRANSNIAARGVVVDNHEAANEGYVPVRSEGRESWWRARDLRRVERRRAGRSRTRAHAATPHRHSHGGR